MTSLTKKVVRLTDQKYGKRRIVVTLAPVKTETFIGMRLKGKRTQYVVALSSLYRLGALWHGDKIKRAKAAARKLGVPWRVAKKEFERQHRL